MTKRRLVFSIGIALVLCGAAFLGFAASRSTANAAGTKIVYVPIDPKVFVGHAVVDGWVAKHNETAIDNHAIQLWDGLTALTSQKVAGSFIPVFDTWFTPCDVYPPTTNPTCNHAIVHNPFDVEIPEQAFRLPRISSTNIFSGVKYNQEMVNFLTQGYNGASYATAAGLLKAIKAGETNLTDTAAPSAMMTKPVYQIISATQPTVIGFWQGPGLSVPYSASTSPLVPTVTTWLQIAVIDPTGKATNAKPVTFCADTIDPTGAVVSHRNYVAPARSYTVFPMSELFTLPLSVADAAHVDQMRADYVARQTSRLLHTYGPRALKQDLGCPYRKVVNPAYAFVGMHVVSAELNNVWTWQTFWWQPNATPIAGAKGPFQHFAYATAYWTLNKKPYGYRYAFNPYLEADFGTATFNQPAWNPQGQPGSVTNLGRTTNCISCHQVAMYTVSVKPSPSPNPGYVAHGDEPQVTPKNTQYILVRNLWSLADRAPHP